MELNDYQKRAMSFAQYPSGDSIYYPSMGLAGEAGEICNKVKKMFHGREVAKELIADEIGDCLWYLAALSRDIGIDLETCAIANIAKLKGRELKGTLIDREKR